MKVCEIFKSIQGEGLDIGQVTTFVRLSGCNLRCTFCIDESAKVLMVDFTWKPLRDVVVGDYVIGVRRPSKNRHLQFVPARVTAKSVSTRDDTVKIHSDIYNFDHHHIGRQQLICTTDHKLLNTKHREFWQRADTFETVTKIIPQNNIDDEAWLHGVLAGDGSFHQYRGKWWRMKLASIDVEILSHVFGILRRKGYPVRQIVHKTPTNNISAVEMTRSQLVEQLMDEIDSARIDEMYAANWLGGFFDAEGYQDRHSIRIAQKPSDTFERAIEFARMLGFRVNVQETSNIGVLIIGDPIAFYARCHPRVKRKQKLPQGIGTCSFTAKTATQYLGEPRTVIDISTTTGNFIANGFIVHNCDTKYAWTESKEMTAAEVASEVFKLGCRNICITGGEPLLQDLTGLLDLLRHRRVTIETNGTVWVDYDVDLWSVSPKLSNSGQLHKARPDIVGRFAREKRNVQLKFVVDNEKDIFEAMEFCDRAAVPARVPVIFQPNNVELKTTTMYVTKLRELAEIVKKIRRPNVRVLPQLHVLLWGKKRGR